MLLPYPDSPSLQMGNHAKIQPRGSGGLSQAYVGLVAQELDRSRRFRYSFLV